MKIVKDIQSSFFDEGNHQYDQSLIFNPPVHCVIEYEHIRKYLPASAKKGEVADYGAGSGRMTIPLLQDGYKTTAIDISPQSLTNLKNVAKRMNFKHLSLEKELPKKESYDAIIGADVLHHVDIDNELPSLYRALKKGGRLIFSEPSAYNISWYLYLPFASKWSVEKGMMQCRYGNLLKLCRKHGFQKTFIEGMGLFPRPVFGGSAAMCKLNDRLGDIPFVKIFAYRYLLVAEK